MKQYLVLCVVMLFIGVAIAPSVYSTPQLTDEEFVEVQTDFCGLQHKPHTTRLTQDEAQKLEMFIEDFKQQLSQIQTQQEVISLYNHAIIKFEYLGLLGELSASRIQKLITNSLQIQNDITLLHQRYPFSPQRVEDTKNVLCLVAGQTTNTFFQAPTTGLVFLSIIPLEILFVICFLLAWVHILPRITGFIASILADIGSLIGQLLDLFIKNKILLAGSTIWLAQSTGWITTIGLLGIKTTTDLCTGKITSNRITHQYFKAWIYGYTDPFEPMIAATGFTGIRVNINPSTYESFYLGSAIQLHIGPP